MISTSFLSHSQSCASRTTLLSGSRSTDIFIFLCVHGLQGIQGQFSFHHGISLAAAPSPAGRCGCSSGGISQVIGAFSGICLWMWSTHPAWNPAVVFHMVLCMFSRITFLHLLRVPCGTGQSGLIQGCDNLWLFQVSEEVCFCRLPPVAHMKADGALQRIQRAA